MSVWNLAAPLAAGQAELLLLGIIVGGIVLLIMLGVLWNFGSLWVQALLSGAPVGMLDLLAMRLRRVPLQMVVQARITAKKAGMDIPTEKWEAHFLAGGKVPDLLRALITSHQGKVEIPNMFDSLASHVLAGGRVQGVVEGLIAAKRAKIDLSFEKACAIDLATLRTDGKNVTEAVTTSVNPRVIDCPDPRKGRQTIDAVAKDGIQLQVKAKVTVRTNLDRILGGATEETIIARVGEGIVSAIGSSESHKEVLENPDKISKAVLVKGLDAQTAFEIVSIDIADVDVGQNIGANLRAQQAQADLQKAQADAEGRAAAARAREQEMKAHVEENRAAVVLAEAEIPKAIAEALRSGKFGVMDYYNLKNIQADTHMREQIGGGSADSV
ncbi:MAG: flotillin-like protein FloA [Planctomycetota bacterium]|nr:flotillin-like protein FloA [Planctomycetota bacterium]